MNALVPINLPAVTGDEMERQATRLRIFDQVPKYHHDVVVLLGRVFVYETDTICRDGILEGALYVREGQHPVSHMPWESWLRMECEDKTRRAQPRSPLKTSREIVRVVRWPRDENLWALRLPSGFTDGPMERWNLGHNFVGKVVGVYQPAAAREPAE